MEDNIFPSALTIAGSDSGGGAGIQADLRSFSAFGVYGTSVITAVTSQNPGEVRRVDILPPEAVQAQMESVLDVIPVKFGKTGMLANKEIVEKVAFLAEKYRLSLVVDPVMISTSGACLLEKAAISAMQEKLFPLAEFLTPNIPEAEWICGKKLVSPDDLAEAARFLYGRYGCNILLKSGHSIFSDLVTDCVCYEGKVFALSSPAVKIHGHTSHGTGCTLSAALTASLAKGKSWKQALLAAKAFVYGSLKESRKIGENLFQMYPPLENNLNKMELKEL